LVIIFIVKPKDELLMPTKFKLRSGLFSAFFLFLSFSLFAQTSITGRVLSSTDKNPIVGATVQVKGGKSATLTGSDGSFTITSSQKVSNLVISIVGYQTMTVPVNGNSVGDVMLAISTTSLNDVVVTGYSSQRKKDITGSVTVVNVKDMKAIVTGNPEQQLQGQAAGVQVIESGVPGGYTQVNIRGITSFGNNDPLYIIDGVQASMHDLNSNDIESVQVLKDAGSAAIYGVQGSNGVIIVTTKKGKPGKAVISYDGYVGTQRPISGNPYNLLNTPGLRDLTLSVNTRLGLTSQLYGGATYTIPDYFYNSSAGPATAQAGDPAILPDKYVFDVNNPQNDYLIAKTSQTGTDWFHSIFTPAPIQNHTISASGASDKSSYFFSFNYFDQQGTLINTFLKRYATRINTLFNVMDHVRIGENAYIFYKQQPPVTNQNEGANISYSYREQPIIPVYDIMGNYGGTFNGPQLGNGQNPVANLQRTANNLYNTWDVIGNVFAEVDFAKHFTIRTSAGGTIDNQYSYNFTYNDYNDIESHTSQNQFNEQSQYNSTLLWTNTLQYNNTFAQKHSLKVLIGTESKNVYGRGMGGAGNSLFSIVPNYWILSNASANITNYSYAYKNNLFSLFGRFDYAYEDKYLLSGTIRRDGSSVLGPSQTYGIFPSVSAGWRLSSEDFMKSTTWINDLKLRGSYGKLGSINNVNANNQFNLFGQNFADSYYDINGTSNTVQGGFYQTQLGNANTGWETDIITNIGLDATLFNNHLDFTVEWYNKTVTGLLQKAQLPAAGIGYPPAPVVNSGSINNKGIDASFTYHGAAGHDFKYNIGVSFTTYNNVVVSIPGTGYFDAGGSRIGSFVRNQGTHPVGAFFGYKVVGMFQDAGDVTKSPVQADAAPGRFKYQDVDGNDTINAADRQFFGNPNPQFTYGLNLNASYKNFDFTMIFYGSYGNQVINYVKYWTDFYDSFNGNKSNALLNNSWSAARPNAPIPQPNTASTFSTDGVPNSFFMENGSFLKCKSLILGYSLSPSILRKVGVDRCRVYLQATNLFQITNYSGIDPELQTSGQSPTNAGNNPGYAYSSSFGIDYGNYPNNQKSYLVGLSFTF
jgi:TonB-dependent starch-binding outer membrane protein SusC